MRTLNEIIAAIKADFVASATIQNLYGIDENRTFDEQFSRVSIEAVISYVFAVDLWISEQVQETKKEEINTIIENNYTCTIPWYYDRCLAYQDGHDLIYDAVTCRFGYEIDEPEAKIVKYAAVRQVINDNLTKLRIYVSDKEKKALIPEQLNRFSIYLNRIGPAGIHYDIISRNPDRLGLTLQINYNPLVLNSDGTTVNSGKSPVNLAIQMYIEGITYGGTFSKTRLIDAIQTAEGVDDVILLAVTYAPDGGMELQPADGQTIESTAACFVIENLDLRYLAA